MTPNRYVVICGGIAVGKTTVTRLVGSKVAGAVAFIEQRDQYLDRYYEDPVAFAFMNQLAYTLQFLEQAAEIARVDAPLVIQDRSIYDTHWVFSSARLSDGSISAEQFELLERAYRAADIIVRPSLLVLLEASPEEAYRRMLNRGEPAERSVSLRYLAELQSLYSEWFDAFDVCPKAALSTDKLSSEGVAENVLRLLTEKVALE